MQQDMLRPGREAPTPPRGPAERDAAASDDDGKGKDTWCRRLGRCLSRRVACGDLWAPCRALYAQFAAGAKELWADARVAWRERAPEAQAYEVRSGVILGEEAGDGSDGSDDTAEVEVFACGPCKKTFKSLKQFENHCVSKAHKKKAGPNWCPPARAPEPEPEPKKKARRRAKKDKEGPAACPPVVDEPKKKGGKKGKKKGKRAESSDDEPASMKCSGCSATFPSRSKLFAHLKANPGHAKLKR